ncbi:2'-5' RNA ligase [Actinomadura mexicana]|uniref:2'-5' RNA ligase n=1 Tax=Actinomadura mexicana TaxID=134959 RepID=A0A239AB87_9ACTN|nr:2'-5' RNA ligase [Actinomadura mexicana]
MRSSSLSRSRTNRWQNREEPGPGQGTLYWHILVGNHPAARDLAHTAQKRLADFHGLHMTPPEWLHITTLVAGSTDEITTEQQQDMLAAASELLAEIPPVDVTLGRIFYHPEAIASEVQPAGHLRQVRKAVQTATLKVTNREGHTEGPAQWTPHMTLAYSETEQPAEPLITALGRELPTSEFTINAVTLVVQQGSERLWDWRPVGQAPFLGSR